MTKAAATARTTATTPATGAGRDGQKTTYREALREAHRDAMTRDPRVFLMGEDVGRYGGCFAVSLGLLEEFGPERIRDAPLSESGFTGAGIGAALGEDPGLRRGRRLGDVGGEGERVAERLPPERRALSRGGEGEARAEEGREVGGEAEALAAEAPCVAPVVGRPLAPGRPAVPRVGHVPGPGHLAAGLRALSEPRVDLALDGELAGRGLHEPVALDGAHALGAPLAHHRPLDAGRPLEAADPLGRDVRVEQQRPFRTLGVEAGRGGGAGLLPREGPSLGFALAAAAGEGGGEGERGGEEGAEAHGAGGGGTGAI